MTSKVSNQFVYSSAGTMFIRKHLHISLRCYSKLNSQPRPHVYGITPPIFGHLHCAALSRGAPSDTNRGSDDCSLNHSSSKKMTTLCTSSSGCRSRLPLASKSGAPRYSRHSRSLAANGAANAGRSPPNGSPSDSKDGSGGVPHGAGPHR